MNANPTSAAAFGASPGTEWRQGTPARDASDVRAPESTYDRDRGRVEDRVRADVTTLETFLSASAVAERAIQKSFGSSSRGVKRRRYGIARGSAVESIGILDLASALGLGDGSSSEPVTARTLFTRVAMMVARLEARFR